MKVLLFIIGALILLLIVWWFRKLRAYNYGRIVVTRVNAGDTNLHKLGDQESEYLSSFTQFYHNGKVVNPSEYIVARVEGDCMNKRGIKSGNIVFIEDLSKHGSLTNGDILYIKYQKDGFEGYKLREFIGHDDVNEKLLKTVYYNSEGKTKTSSTSHSIENVEGVVKYNFS